ncbi:uncharacterized protein LOC113295295 [Papaver somniferum]|uniref:uncharacterized protein LOC113295295 n=1 Tax=Papaver somniferum TaxID=3469 RepID=UPI000E6FFFCA|nr:uncharacterized protein LOC113295295 [Papaver somniferum]
MKEDYTALRDNDTWDYVPPEPHMNILGCKWVYKVKQKADGTIDRLKSRLVAKGYNQQDGIDYNETFSPVVKSTTVRVVLYHSMFVYYSAKGMIVLLLYVDDILLTGNSPTMINNLIVCLKKEFAMKELGDLGYFFGLEAVRDDNSITLTQQKYTLELLEKDGMLESKPCDTPVAKGARLSVNDGVKIDNPVECRTIVGALQYLTVARPDICFGVNYVSQFMHSPTDMNLQLVKRILRYLKGSIGMGITLTKGNLHKLKSFTDSDWDGCPNTRRSTSGYAVYIGSNLVSWSSKKQPTVSMSSAVAGYKFLYVASAELQWLSYLLADLHIQLDNPTLLLCDNTSALSLATNPVFHARTKHIEIQYHTVRELVEEGFLQLQHIASEDQVAELFTKGLCSPTFTRLLQRLLGLSLTSSTATTIAASSIQIATLEE